MISNTRVLSVYQAFFSGGARVLHSEVSGSLHQSGAQWHSVLSIHDQVMREGTVQPMQEDPRYKQLVSLGVPIHTLGRRATGALHAPDLTPHELATLKEYADGADVVLSLKEQPIKPIVQADIAPPVIACLHRSDPENQGESLQALKDAIDMGKVALCTISAESAKQAYKTHGIPGDKIRVILNGVNLERFSHSPRARAAIRNELAITADAPVVLIGARYDTMKNIPLFLQSSYHFLKTNPNAHVLMCGAGMTQDNPSLINDLDTIFDDAPDLRARIKTLGIRHDMPAIYSAADVTASTSSHGETYQLTLVEGAACNAVPVTTNVGDALSIVQDGVGLCTGTAPEEISEAWQKAIRNKLQHLSAIKRRRDDFDRRHMVEQYRQTIEEVRN